MTIPQFQTIDTVEDWAKSDLPVLMAPPRDAPYAMVRFLIKFFHLFVIYQELQ